MPKKITQADLKVVEALYIGFAKLERRECSFETWVMLKLSCTPARARALVAAYDPAREPATLIKVEQSAERSQPRPKPVTRDEAVAALMALATAVDKYAYASELDEALALIARWKLER